MVNIFYSERFLLHDTGYGHPEHAGRVAAAFEGIQQLNLDDRIEIIEPRRATVEELKLVHTSDHIQNVRQTSEKGGFRLDPDTGVSPESYDVALQSAGAWLDAVDKLVDEGQSSFIISRPPGHHAERNKSMGFCLFNNCAIAATYAQLVKGLNKVAVLDWDVHHGNGTQHILESNPDAAYCSIHQWPFYPGTGAEQETGEFGNVLNLPLPHGSGAAEYGQAFRQKLIPFLKSWGPDLLFISAGFDASLNDPLGGMELLPEHFAEFTHLCYDLTPHLVLGLEGGYDLNDLRNCVAAVTRVMVDRDPQ